MKRASGRKTSSPGARARRGARPRAAPDQRTKWAYIFGALCPAKGKGAGLVMPYCNSPAMTAPWAEISQAVEANAHGVVRLDQAGWHLSAKVPVPDTITPHAGATPVTGTEPGGKHLAVHARQLALQHRVHVR